MIIAKHNTQSLDGLSQRYRHVNTMDIHKVLLDHGFQEKGYRESNVRKPEREGFQKHFSVFHRPEMNDGHHGNFNVLLFNGHDGTSAIRMELGYFRVICENQLVNSQLGFKVAHTGDVLERLNQRIPLLLKGYEDFRGLKERLEGIELDWEQTSIMVEEGLRIRELDAMHVEDETLKNQILSHNRKAMNHARRGQDMGFNAWATLNRIQENTIKGTPWDFMNQTNKGENESVIYRKLRAVNNLDRVIRFNKQLTDKMVQIAGAA